MTEFAVAYDNSGEPQLHLSGCRELQPTTKHIHGKGLVSPAWYFEAETLEEAQLATADAYAEDLDLFDGRYETIEAARELSVRCVATKPCATKGAK